MTMATIDSNSLFKLLGATRKARDVFETNFPTLENPFDIQVEALGEVINTVQTKEHEEEYNFGTPECAVLLERHRLETILHRADPERYAEPPTLVYPPDLRAIGYLTDQAIMEIVAANINVVPPDYTITLPGYQVYFKNYRPHIAYSVLSLYGEKVTIRDLTPGIKLNRNQLYEGMSKVALMFENTDIPLPLLEPSDLSGVKDLYLDRLLELAESLRRANHPMADTLFISRGNSLQYGITPELAIINWRVIYNTLVEDARGMERYWQPLEHSSIERLKGMEMDLPSGGRAARRMPR